MSERNQAEQTNGFEMVGTRLKRCGSGDKPARREGGEFMAQVKIAGCVIDTRTAAELLRIIKEIPADKRAEFLDELKNPELYAEDQ